MYIDDKDVYALVGERGMSMVHCSQIDALPRADVVPKSEVEATVEKLMSATDKVICEAKAEVAREIFEEIEKAIGKRLQIDDHMRTYGQDSSISYKTLAKLKKKYTEGEE